MATSGLTYGIERRLGVYAQRQEGFFMQRIPLLGGCIAPTQLAAIAELSRRFCAGAPLHLTTRQDIELHDVPQAVVTDVQKRLADIGINTYGAGGDCVRNITVCPRCSYDATAADMLPAAKMLRDFILSQAARLDLPRKFKFSFCGCPQPAARAFIQDMAFIGLDTQTVRVVGAGSLGPKPQTGIVLYEQIAPTDIVALTMAALEMFAKHGDRQNRRAARLRHVRQRLGEEVFLSLLSDLFKKRKSTDYPKIKLQNGRDEKRLAASLQCIGGDLTVEQADALAQTAQTADAEIRITLWHGIDLFARQPITLPAILRPLANLPRIVACPGCATCPNGLTDTKAAAAKVADLLRQKGLLDKTVGISGCANHCALSAVCQIGLVGRKKTVDDVYQEVYEVFTDGGDGNTATLSQPSNDYATVEQLSHKVL